MKKNNIYFALVLLFLVVIIGWSAVTMLTAGREEESYSVSVIVSDSNNDRWTAMREGMEQAAVNNGIELNYMSTGVFSDTDEEMQIIAREIENGADGIIVQMVDSDVDLERMEFIDSSVALMLIETDVRPEELYAYTGPDNYEIGMAIAGAVLEDFGLESDGKKIGILIGNQGQVAMQKRLEGVKDTLEGTGVEIAWEIADSPETVAKLTANQDESEVNAIIALGNEETEITVDYFVTESDGKPVKSSLYGVGYSEKSVYYLDKGVIQRLVVPYEFNMGYQSMEEIAQQLKFHLTDAENRKVGYLVVDRETLYDEENQKILFPIVQ